MMDQPVTKLSLHQADAMEAWRGLDKELSYLSFEAVANRSECPPPQIRRVVRALAKKGLLVFKKGLWNDQGEMRGAGYGLTDAGIAYLESTRDFQTCEQCGRSIEIGDKCVVDWNMIYLCEECAPFVADLLDKEDASFIDDEGDTLPMDLRRNLYDILIAQGNKPSDRFGLKIYGGDEHDD